MMVVITYQIVLSTLQTVGILVGIFYYLQTLRNQNKTRQGQLLMQTYGRIDQPDRIKALSSMFQWEFTSKEQILDKLANDLNFMNEFGNVHLFIEGLASMVRLNYIDIEGVAALFGGGISLYWSKIAPWKEAFTEYLYPRWCMETEYLITELYKYGEKHPELQINP